jgi:sarcosine oxidase, subunit gamma
MANIEQPLPDVRSEPSLAPSLLQVSEPSPFGRIIVRLGRSALRLRDEVSAVLGVRLPDGPGAVTAQRPSALWRACGEWLVVADMDQCGTLVARLQQTLSNATAFVNDYSDALSVIDVKGAAASSLLSSGCALDTSAWPDGVAFCAPTAFAGVHVLLHRIEPDRFHIYVDRSLASYLWTWVRTSAVEFSGTPIEVSSTSPQVES